MPRAFNRATLTPLREMPSEDALALLAIYRKADPTFQPVKQATTAAGTRVRQAVSSRF